MDLSKASSLLVSFLFIGSPGPRGPQFLELHLPPLPPSSVIPSFSASLLLLFSDSSWGRPSSWLLRVEAEEEPGWGGYVVGCRRFGPGLRQAFPGSQWVADSPMPCELLPAVAHSAPLPSAAQVWR